MQLRKCKKRQGDAGPRIGFSGGAHGYCAARIESGLVVNGFAMLWFAFSVAAGTRHGNQVSLSRL